MSLVIAYFGKDYQLWCSDGLTIELNDHGCHIVSDTVAKVLKHPAQSILQGWSGDRYDAQFVIDSQKSSNGIISTDQFLHEFSKESARVNSESKAFSYRNNEAYSQTGFIVGGYNDTNGFLCVVTPKGNIHYRRKYAIIGFGAQTAYDILSDFNKSYEPSIVEAYEMIMEVFNAVAKKNSFVNNLLFPFLLTPNSFWNLSTITMCYKNSPETAQDQHKIALQTFANSNGNECNIYHGVG